jgi:hypothetical protein
VVFARDIGQHGEAASDDGTLGAPQREEIRLGNHRVKVVGREWASSYQNVNLISIVLELHWFSTAKDTEASRAECGQ